MLSQIASYSDGLIVFDKINKLQSLRYSMAILESYKAKRNFLKTKEPKPKKIIKAKENLAFVVQEHDATHLHWDFRIEVNGVMPSWAITKEPNNIDKRLAVMTEDHPLEYAKFHGTIPEGYGAGTVKIWDNGIYENLRTINLKKSIEDGKIEIKIKGKKLKGNYALIRLKPTEKYPGKNNWLFFKMKDEK